MGIGDFIIVYFSNTIMSESVHLKVENMDNITFLVIQKYSNKLLFSVGNAVT